MSHETSLADFLPFLAQLSIEKKKNFRTKGTWIQTLTEPAGVGWRGEVGRALYPSTLSSVRCCKQPQRGDVRAKELHLQMLMW